MHLHNNQWIAFDKSDFAGWEILKVAHLHDKSRASLVYCCRERSTTKRPLRNYRIVSVPRNLGISLQSDLAERALATLAFRR